MLLFIHPFSYSPIAVVRDVKRIQANLNSSNMTNSLVNGVIAMGMWRK